MSTWTVTCEVPLRRELSDEELDRLVSAIDDAAFSVSSEPVLAVTMSIDADTGSTAVINAQSKVTGALAMALAVPRNRYVIRHFDATLAS